MRRRAETQSLEQKPKFVLSFRRRNLQHVENLLLRRGIVNTNAATADFRAVQNQVVGLGADFARTGFQLGQIFIFGRGKRMMQRLKAFFVRVPFKQRKIHHPEKLDGLLRDQFVIGGQFTAQSPKSHGRNRGIARHHK